MSDELDAGEKCRRKGKNVGGTHAGEKVSMTVQGRNENVGGTHAGEKVSMTVRGRNVGGTQAGGRTQEMKMQGR